MKNGFIILLKLVLVATFMFNFSNGVLAQGTYCTSTIKTKTGKVFSARKATISQYSANNEITIKVRKTAGKAETQMNIYIDGRIQRTKKVEWDAGNYTDNGRYTNRKLTNVKNKRIKVEIINQSISKTFSYKLKFDRKSSSLSTHNDNSGRIDGGMRKTIYTSASCTSKTRLSISRNGFTMVPITIRPKVEIRVWEKLNNGSWRHLPAYNRTMERNEVYENITVSSNKPLKVELKNKSAVKALFYEFLATPGRN